MMVIEEPRIDVAFAQRRLDGIQLHGQTPIVNKSWGLGESRFTVHRSRDDLRNETLFACTVSVIPVWPGIFLRESPAFLC
jgi:hypothetical protein